MWALRRAVLRRGHTPTIPAGVLAEAWRGGPQFAPTSPFTIAYKDQATTLFGADLDALLSVDAELAVDAAKLFPEAVTSVTNTDVTIRCRR